MSSTNSGLGGNGSSTIPDVNSPSEIKERWFEEETIRNSVFRSNLLVNEKNVLLGDDIHNEHVEGLSNEMKCAKIKLNAGIKDEGDEEIYDGGGQITVLNYGKDVNKEGIAIGTATKPLSVLINSNIDHTTHTGTVEMNVDVDEVKVHGQSTFEGGIIVNGLSAFNNTLNVAGNMGVTGFSSFQNSSEFNNDVNINGGMMVNSAATFKDSVDVTNALNVSGTLNAGEKLTVNDTGINVNASMTATETATFSKGINVDNSMSVNAPATFGRGEVTISDKLTVGGSAKINDTINIDSTGIEYVEFSAETSVGNDGGAENVNKSGPAFVTSDQVLHVQRSILENNLGYMYIKINSSRAVCDFYLTWTYKGTPFSLDAKYPANNFAIEGPYKLSVTPFALADMTDEEYPDYIKMCTFGKQCFVSVTKYKTLRQQSINMRSVDDITQTKITTNSFKVNADEVNLNDKLIVNSNEINLNDKLTVDDEEIKVTGALVANDNITIRPNYMSVDTKFSMYDGKFIADDEKVQTSVPLKVYSGINVSTDAIKINNTGIAFNNSVSTNYTITTSSSGIGNTNTNELAFVANNNILYASKRLFESDVRSFDITLKYAKTSTSKSTYGHVMLQTGLEYPYVDLTQTYPFNILKDMYTTSDAMSNRIWYSTNTEADDGTFEGYYRIGTTGGLATEVSKVTLETYITRGITIDTANDKTNADFDDINVSGTLTTKGDAHIEGKLCLDKANEIDFTNTELTGSKDYARIKWFDQVTGDGSLEIATADEKVEPIYVRQYTKDGSNLFATVGNEITLLDKNGHTNVTKLNAQNISATNTINVDKLTIDKDSIDMNYGDTTESGSILFDESTGRNTDTTAIAFIDSSNRLLIRKDHLTAHAKYIKLQINSKSVQCDMQLIWTKGTTAFDININEPMSQFTKTGSHQVAHTNINKANISLPAYPKHYHLATIADSTYVKTFEYISSSLVSIGMNKDNNENTNLTLTADTIITDAEYLNLNATRISATPSTVVFNAINQGTGDVPYQFYEPGVADGGIVGAVLGKDGNNYSNFYYRAAHPGNGGHGLDIGVVDKKDIIQINKNNIRFNLDTPKSTRNSVEVFANIGASTGMAQRFGQDSNHHGYFLYRTGASTTSTDDSIELGLGGLNGGAATMIKLNRTNMELPFGNINLTNTNENQITLKGATNDIARIRMYANNGTSNDGVFEIATCDDANEPIVIRQYKGTWTTLQRELKLLDGVGNTYIPGTLYVKDQDILTDINNLKALL